MTATMLAAAHQGANTIEVGERPIPDPEPGAVRIRVEACGVCGSDLHFFHLGPIVAGNTPGHEIAGRVDALGDGVTGFASGERVVVEPLASCGTCAYCRSGRDAICPQLQFYGVHRPGGMAEYLCIAAHRLFRVPDGLEAPVAALTEPMAVGIHGLRLGRLEAGQRVLVLGAGSVGLLTALAALELGAGEVWVTARHPHQAALAERFGAARVLTGDETTPQALASVGQEAPIDLVVETVGGAADTLRAAAACVRPGGVISVLGLFLGGVTLDSLPLFLKENTLVWSNCYARNGPTADFAAALDVVARRSETLGEAVTHRVPLGEIGRAFDLAGDKSAGSIKVSVEPQ